MRLNRLDVLCELVKTVRVDESGNLLDHKLLAIVPVHCAGCRIGLNHKTGLQIMKDQPITGGFKDALVMLFPFFSLG